eukprot:m.304213 g.304213  ORF g.304213 m.304213 type:complete len:61 (-) comp15896_c0_seq2:4563-4745(-)
MIAVLSKCYVRPAHLTHTEGTFGLVDFFFFFNDTHPIRLSRNGQATILLSLDATAHDVPK